jgi:hypothetical protein
LPRWQPIPEGRIVVGLDCGYIRNWQDRRTNFEVIVGRSMPADCDARYVGLVHGYDSKSQGLQANQDVTFLTDGGEEIRAPTELVTPVSEHVLDWFRITMPLTGFEQYAAVSPTTMKQRARTCYGSNGCSGTATDIG